MDHSAEIRNRNRIGVECARMIATGHASCEDTGNHIRSSRSAIVRSLELLSRPFLSLTD